jgi:Flp pilus assembly pilin Flp
MSYLRSITLYAFCKAQTLTSFVAADEEGQALSEYSLILVLVSIVAMAALTLLSGQIRTELQNIANAIGRVV